MTAGERARPRITPLPRVPAGEGGFTLLEVLVALAILSLAVVAGIQLFAGGLRLLKLAGEHQEATLIADQKTRELTGFAEGRETGSEDGFTWERTVQRTEVPPELVTATEEPYEMYAVTVRVSWDHGRSVEVATLRTARPTVPGAATTPPQSPR